MKSAKQKNVVVFPNAIDPTEGQFKQPTIESEKIRVGWLGGSSHLHDLMLLDGFVQKNGKDINDKLNKEITWRLWASGKFVGTTYLTKNILGSPYELQGPGNQDRNYL